MMGYVLPHPAVPIKLPSIRSLLLDLPEPIPNHESTSPKSYREYAHPYPTFDHHYSAPTDTDLRHRPGSNSYQLPSPSTSPLENNRLSTLVRVSTSMSKPPPPPEFLGVEPPQKRARLLVLPQLPPTRSASFDQSSCDQSVESRLVLPAAEGDSAGETEGTDHHDSAGSDGDSRPRKKRQCPQCNLFFSNLATHKSTHLKPTSRPHVCKYCHRGFARPNDLFRHTKCHWKEIGSDRGQFKCPFKQALATGADDHCCHPSGIFSRCDTFKNHLKAIHFKYPAGTRKEERSKVAGTCRLCQQHFANVDDWLNNHVEKGACTFQHHD